MRWEKGASALLCGHGEGDLCACAAWLDHDEGKVGSDEGGERDPVRDEQVRVRTRERESEQEEIRTCERWRRSGTLPWF